MTDVYAWHDPAELMDHIELEVLYATVKGSKVTGVFSTEEMAIKYGRNRSFLMKVRQWFGAE